MKNIFYFPFFKERGDLNDQLARASWYLSCLNPAKVYFPVDLEDAAAFRFEVPRYLEKGLTSIFEPFWRKIVLLNVKEEKALIDSFNRSTIIMQWKKNEYPSYLWEKKIDQEKITKQLWRVDRFNERFEGSFYIKVGIERQNYPQLEKDLEENKQKFMNMAKEIGSVRRAYIFGTGPTIAQYKEFDYSDGLTIICNSIIFDPEILKYIKPKILTFGDPIFHFGISRYASTFRKKLTGVLKEHKMYLLIPFNYYRLFTYHFPQYKDITIAIPFKYGSFINLNLIDQFYLYPAGNVLTLLMLPIACTFADEISILGSDGRKKIDDSYFWTHNPGTQINDKMENIKEAHPSFFNIDYNEYYDGHIELLEAYLTALEKMKKIYRTLTPSYIPVLRKRYEYRNKAYEKDFYPLVSIIMPIYSYKARSAGSIETAAASVAHQNYKNWELIIVVMVNEAESNNMNLSSQLTLETK